MGARVYFIQHSPMPCTCTRISSKGIKIQRYHSPLTIRATFSEERLITPPPSTLDTSFPLIEISPKESNKRTGGELQLAESGISDDENSDIQVCLIIHSYQHLMTNTPQVFLRDLIARYLKPKTCFSKQNSSALDTVYQKVVARMSPGPSSNKFRQAKEHFPCLQNKDELLTGIIRQELRKQNTNRSSF